MATLDQTIYRLPASGCVRSNASLTSARSCSTSDSGNEAVDCDVLKPQAPEPSLERTVSQAVKRKQVDHSMAKIRGAEQSVFVLHDQVGKLRKQESNIDGTWIHGDREVDDLQKRARNLGEDLLQETLQLDSLTGLLPEDRAERKRALNLAEKILETVDDAKSALVQVRHALAKEDKPSEATAPYKSVAKSVLTSQSSASDKSEAVPMSDGELPLEEDSQKMPIALEGVHGCHIAVPRPKLELWERLHLPLELRMQEHPHCYVLLADVAGLASDSLKLRIKESGLRIAGLNLPNLKETVMLQDHVQSHLQKLALDKIHQSGGIEQAANALYAQAGRGSFGSFAETIRLPRDVEHSGIRASCKDGQLQVLIPKVRYAQPGWRSARQPQANSFHGFPYATRSPFFDW